MPLLSDQMQILQSDDEIVHLTPIHVAIIKGNLEMVKFICGLNQIDIAMALSAQVTYCGNDSVMEKLFPY